MAFGVDTALVGQVGDAGAGGFDLWWAAAQAAAVQVNLYTIVCIIVYIIIYIMIYIMIYISLMSLAIALSISLSISPSQFRVGT